MKVRGHSLPVPMEKLTGKPAACFSIAGPGATNMYTGMWDARVDRSPMLALTGQVATQVVGTGNFQEVDLVNCISFCLQHLITVFREIVSILK